MSLRTEDPPEWSYERVEYRNKPEIERLYRGMVRGIRDLSLQDWDLPILDCGMEGTGKSAFAINLACDLDDDIIPHLEDHVLWDVKKDVPKLENRIKHLSPTVFILDEAGKDLLSRNAMEKEQKQIIELAMVMREYNHILILVLPKQRWIDPYMRDHRVTLWAQVYWVGSFFNRERGYVRLRYATHDDFASSAYWNPIFTMRFPNFPPEIEEKYKTLKRLNSLARSEPDELTEMEKIVLNAKSQGKTLRQIGDFLGYSHTGVRKIILSAEEKQKRGYETEL